MARHYFDGRFTRREALWIVPAGLATLAILSGLRVKDPYALKDPRIPNAPVSQDPGSRKPIDPAGPGKTLIFVVAGQSNAANHDAAAYAVANVGKVLNFSVYDGKIYPLEDPLLGCTYRDVSGHKGSSWQGRLGDKILAANWADRIIFVPIAVAGTSVQSWAVGGEWNHRISVAARRLSDCGLGSLVSGVLWQQGESDLSLGTSEASYASSLASVINTFRTHGIFAPIFVARCTRQNDGSVSPAVRAAQTAIVDHSNGIWSGPDSDSLGAEYRDSAGAHFNARGSDMNAQMHFDALQAFGHPFSRST